MSLYRNGDVENKSYQAKLFDAFLVAAYLYDDHFKLEFNITGKKNLVDVPLDASLVDSIESNAPAGCSYKVSFGPPKESQTNTTPTIYAVGGVFVLVCPLCAEK